MKITGGSSGNDPVSMEFVLDFLDNFLIVDGRCGWGDEDGNEGYI
jgi:hypothetical protein